MTPTRIREQMIGDIKERRSRADVEATHLRFPDELAPRWRDVDILLEKVAELEAKSQT